MCNVKAQGLIRLKSGKQKQVPTSAVNANFTHYKIAPSKASKAIITPADLDNTASSK
jgi:hypothetical protein